MAFKTNNPYPSPRSPWQTPPASAEEYVRRIEEMGQRIHGYVQFMTQVGSLEGISSEEKEKAIVDFHNHLAALENQLGHIQENLRLQ